MGAPGFDVGYAVAVDGSDNVYVAGSSGNTWGSPVNAHAGPHDAFVVKFSNNITMPWVPLLLLAN